MHQFDLSEEALARYRQFSCLDVHTEGEPLRIITSGYPEIPGDTMLAKRQYLTAHLDSYRSLLMHEPRGHADMYGALITEAVTPEADFGVLFMHNQGYSSMCGHGILGLLKAACETGAITLSRGPRAIGIDTPAGLVRASVERLDDGSLHASFLNVPSWAEALDCSVKVPELGVIAYDIGFGGAYYAYVDADRYGISCRADNQARLIALGQSIKQAVMAVHPLTHPLEADLSFLYGTIFTSREVTDPGAHSRHVCIFADGELDRSPTGTGVAGRIALLMARNEAQLGQALTIESIVDGRMTVTGVERVGYQTKDAVIARVSGRAFITGRQQFLLDPQDVFQTGFMLAR
ncbi:proline racemase family protein [Shewanella sp. AS16]|uniref:proline racemase family protein n=1 Tax=Shewanella sp. AS16 TaxID=2907625 RepID=UPI001F3FC8AA|nr:proline racemase family protein [Shewanella sp. AS16]MCE9686925.1 proline racemase family protein [Shewanella sp. AS16]